MNLAQPCVFVKQLPGLILCASYYYEDSFSRSYGVNLPSSLTVSRSSALVYSTRPRVSVWGTGGRYLMLRGFSWEPVYHRYPFARGRKVLSSSTRGTNLAMPCISTLFNVRFRRYAGVSLLRLLIAISSSNGILTVSAIDVAVWLCLRSRLTLI